MSMDYILKNAGQSKKQEGGHRHWGQNPSSFQNMSWFILRADKYMEPTG